MQPKLIVEQKITIFANKYSIFATNADGSKGNIVAFAQQKRVAIKEKVTFYTDQSKQQELFSFRAEKAIDIHGKYFVEDANGQRIGAFKKEFVKSLFMSTWNILDSSDAPTYQISENNQALAILRRFGGQIPLVGGLIDIICVFIKYHFQFISLASNTVVGKYTKTTLLRDRYLLELSEADSQKIDWRVLASIAVALDALQSR